MELIDLINELKDFRQKGFLDCNVEAILLKLKKIENGKKVEVPRFVAGYIEDTKACEWDLEDVFKDMSSQLDYSDLYQWFYKEGNMDVFARAWLDGYEIEQEKNYSVRFKNIRKETSYLKYDRVVKNWYLGAEEYSKERKTCHTKEELKKYGFGWVFDCPGIEVKEVKE